MRKHGYGNREDLLDELRSTLTGGEVTASALKV
jgi:hypothetical protein